jgi:hypothetical protein
VRRREGERRFDVGKRFASVCPGRPYIRSRLKLSKCAAAIRSRARFVAIVDAAERLQVRRVEALDAERQAIDAGGAEGGELVGFDRAGVGFERDFGLGQERQAGADRRQQLVERFAGKQARRAAAEEDADDLASPDQRQRRFESAISAAMYSASGMPPRASCELKSQ